MTTQDILFIVGLSALGVGVVLLGIAAYIFFNRNIRALVADLNGTKRAEALEEMAREASRSRRKSKPGETTGAIGQPTDGFSSDELRSAEMVGEASATTTMEDAVEVSDSAATTVMEDDSAATTVLDSDSADVTTLLTTEENTNPQPEVEADKTNVMPAAKQKPVVQESIPDSFHIVRKIVLVQSVEFIKPEQGDGYA